MPGIIMEAMTAVRKVSDGCGLYCREEAECNKDRDGVRISAVDIMAVPSLPRDIQSDKADHHGRDIWHSNILMVSDRGNKPSIKIRTIRGRMNMTPPMLDPSATGYV